MENAREFFRLTTINMKLSPDRFGTMANISFNLMVIHKDFYSDLALLSIWVMAKAARFRQDFSTGCF